MTTSSLNTRQMEYWQPVSIRTHGETPEPTQERETAPIRHASEIQRMKDFAGRHRFQAPVADDFARGMLPPGHGTRDDTDPVVHVRGALASVMHGLRSLCTGQRAEGHHVPDAFKLD
ncbi:MULTISPECIES: hypothetical protein [Pseudomonas]|uniref:hypothetical protein n=1 Tax=Pseudomonas TaxID=286 RepID=UPI00257FDAD7|nr:MULTISPECIES: hypothetical protein [Pseudomonas]